MSEHPECGDCGPDLTSEQIIVKLREEIAALVHECGQLKLVIELKDKELVAQVEARQRLHEASMSILNVCAKPRRA